MTVHELNHVGITVSDLGASVGFYERVLGARVVFRSFIESAGTDVVYLQIADGLIELLHTAGAEEKYGIDHVAFLTADLDAEVAALAAAGTPVLVEPKRAGSGYGRLAFVAGPGGERVELIQRDTAARLPLLAEGPIAEFDHYAVRADDLAASARFYGELVGLQPVVTLTFPSNGRSLPYLGLGTDTLELLDTTGMVDAAHFDHIALRVTDLDATLERMSGLGVQPDAGTPKAAGTGLGRLAAIRDPDGVKIELLDRPALRTL